MVGISQTPKGDSRDGTSANTQHLTFRISALPDSPVAIPRALGVNFDVEPGARWADVTTSAGRSAGPGIPDDVFLYEASVGDLSSTEDVWTFARALSGAVVPTRVRWSDLHVEDGRSYLELLQPFADALGHRVTKADLARMGRGRVHVAEVAVRQGLLRDLADVITSGWIESDSDVPADHLLATVEHATAALRVFAPQFGFALGAQWLASNDVFAPVNMRFDSASGFQIAVLQAFNRLAGNVQPRTCARAVCGRRFYAQRDRAAHSERDSHRRSDAIYCSAACAKRAATQAWRERKRAEKAGN